MHETIDRMTDQLAQALTTITPTTQDVMEHSVAFSPIRWKTGWPHHLRRVPPFRDDAHATITRAEVFEFAADVHASGYNRDQIIDFLGAAFAYRSGQTTQVMQMQQFLRNKNNAAQLLAAIRKLEGVFSGDVTGDGAGDGAARGGAGDGAADGSVADVEPAVEAYELLTATGLPPRFASAVAYFLAGVQGTGESDKPVIICKTRAEVAGLEPSGEWSGAEYGEYLARLRAARDDYDTSLPLDAVEYAAREFADR